VSPVEDRYKETYKNDMCHQLKIDTKRHTKMACVTSWRSIQRDIQKWHVSPVEDRYKETYKNVPKINFNPGEFDMCNIRKFSLLYCRLAITQVETEINGYKKIHNLTYKWIIVWQPCSPGDTKTPSKICYFI
jgi:hypothetical protein